MSDETASSAIDLATELTIAWLGNANTRATADEVPVFLSKVFETVTFLAENKLPTTVDDAPEEAAPEYEPAVSVRKSLASKDHILSMIDGKPYRTLTRHLSSNGLTPKEYRERYNLKSDYPMVAESYSTARREMAKKLGLGRKPKVVVEAAPAAVSEPPKRGRRKAATPAT